MRTRLDEKGTKKKGNNHYILLFPEEKCNITLGPFLPENIT